MHGVLQGHLQKGSQHKGELEAWNSGAMPMGRYGDFTGNILRKRALKVVTEIRSTRLKSDSTSFQIWTTDPHRIENQNLNSLPSGRWSVYFQMPCISCHGEDHEAQSSVNCPNHSCVSCWYTDCCVILSGTWMKTTIWFKIIIISSIVLCADTPRVLSKRACTMSQMPPLLTHQHFDG